MARHDRSEDAPGFAASTGTAGRLADCPACGRTFDVDMRRIIAPPVDLRQCPTCNHLRDIQCNEPVPQLLILPAGWAGAIAAGPVLISAVPPARAEPSSAKTVPAEPAATSTVRRLAGEGEGERARRRAEGRHKARPATTAGRL